MQFLGDDGADTAEGDAAACEDLWAEASREDDAALGQRLQGASGQMTQGDGCQTGTTHSDDQAQVGTTQSDAQAQVVTRSSVVNEAYGLWPGRTPCLGSAQAVL